MRKADIGSLIDYMYWVNRRLLDAASGLANEEFTRVSSVTIRDLRSTLVHELDVEWSWRLNLQGRPEEEFGSDKELRPEDYPDARSLAEHWSRDEAEMRAWLASLTDDDVEDQVPSVLTGDERPLWQFLLHVVTHGQQQQADAATLLTLAGRSPGELSYLAYLKSIEPA